MDYREALRQFVVWLESEWYALQFNEIISEVQSDETKGQLLMIEAISEKLVELLDTEEVN